jgi:molybdate transport system ATP-binding protein
MDLLEIDIAVPRRAFAVRAALTLDAETVAILGPSGAGKTSLLRAVAGLERGCTGRIALGGTTWLDSPGRTNVSPERRRVGYLPQDYGLFPHLTVAGNVRFAGGGPRPDLLDQLGIAHLAHARPHTLSGGERQRVALARALARDPQVLLLDEPFGALDVLTRRRVRDELADMLASLKLPVLLVTHAFEDATALASRIAVIDRGELVQLDTPEGLLDRPATVMVAALTGANILSGTATPTATGSTIRLIGGGELASSTAANGAVQVAVHPWQLELADPSTCRLTDTVVGIQRDGGVTKVRLARFMIHTSGVNLSEGASVGVRAAPADVHVLEPAS